MSISLDLSTFLDAGFATWRERYIGDMTRARSEAESYTPPLELRCCVDLPVASQLLPKYILDQIRQWTPLFIFKAPHPFRKSIAFLDYFIAFTFLWYDGKQGFRFGSVSKKGHSTFTKH